MRNHKPPVKSHLQLVLQNICVDVVYSAPPTGFRVASFGSRYFATACREDDAHKEESCTCALDSRGASEVPRPEIIEIIYIEYMSSPGR